MLLYVKLLSKDGLIHKFFFWIAASAADIPDDKLNEIKTLLANGVSTLFIHYKANINAGIGKFQNRPYWIAIFLVVSFNVIPLFSKDLITFIISFNLWFVTVARDAIGYKIPFLIFLPVILVPGSTSISFSVSVIFHFFANEFVNDVIF